MKTTRSTCLLLSLLLMLLALTPRSTQAVGPPTTCSISSPADLAPLPGDTVSAAYAVNASGVVVGLSGTQDASGNFVIHAVRWDPGTTTPTGAITPTDLGMLSPTTSSVANDINASGEVVGYSGSRAVVWAPGAATPTALDPLPGDAVSAAYAVNASGVVVGLSGTQNASGNFVTHHAVRWDPGTTIPTGAITPTALSTSPSSAWAINANGQVVGDSGGAVEWASGATTPTALGQFPGDTLSGARAVNASGVVVGLSGTQDASGNLVTHAMRWDAGAATPTGAITPTDLGTLGITSTMALGINASGQVVGVAGTLPNGAIFGRAVLWNVGATTPTDLGGMLLPGSGWVLESANAINDAGQIVGAGIFNGAAHGFRLTCS